MAPAEGVLVEVLYCAGPGQVDAVSLTLPAGSTVAEAVAASGLLQRHGLAAGIPCGIWGKVRPAETVLRARDRVELYRPLTVDPKEARRLRYKRHRAPRPAG
jgi:putative ubiquitin-RnfH superfamily antitoxin RatB of RatAB toxin-antitoxin module